MVGNFDILTRTKKRERGSFQTSSSNGFINNTNKMNFILITFRYIVTTKDDVFQRRKKIKRGKNPKEMELKS